ncbi:MAG: type II toxin-antitoxin system VapC family toxin [Deltaproteobacteria bacterium]|jgi:PIN domain nuclease of toxin-antitoxin system|nr:type II toxin-antitoxin system VapC family toxin [Deltaproteobacteria bacterium]MBT4527842.1 type II toxin-antitoxin system VapC family toxin [Deltaproteobacteria bacterium]
MVYLDTHVVVWMYQNDQTRFSKKVIEIINSGNDLFVSPIVILELEYLFEIGRLQQHGKIIIDYLVNRINLNICKHPFSDIISQSLKLNWTRDPFDRIITSHALINKSILITKDEVIHKNYEKAYW